MHVAHDLAIVHDDVALGVASNIEFVSDHDDRHPLVVQILEHAHDLDAGPAVQVAGRFVGQQKFWLIDQSARDGDALLLAAGKLVWVMTGALAQAHDFQRSSGAFPLLASADAWSGVEHRQLGVFQRRSAREQIETLKNKTDFFVAQSRQFITA